MLKDGKYAAWFKTPLGQGTGIAHVADGRIWGHDSIVNYIGTCSVDGDRFTAVLTIKRHSEGHATVFGVDDLTLRLEGTCPGKIARFTGTADQVPEALLEGTLIFSEKQPATRDKSEPARPFDASRLPKPPTRFR